jgi:hypothetical protein
LLLLSLNTFAFEELVDMEMRWNVSNARSHSHSQSKSDRIAGSSYCCCLIDWIFVSVFCGDDCDCIYVRWYESVIQSYWIPFNIFLLVFNNSIWTLFKLEYNYLSINAFKLLYYPNKSCLARLCVDVIGEWCMNGLNGWIGEYECVDGRNECVLIELWWMK